MIWHSMPLSAIVRPIQLPGFHTRRSRFRSFLGKFAFHEICDGGSSWLNSVNILSISSSYHPTAAGQEQGYEPVFASVAG